MQARYQRRQCKIMKQELNESITVELHLWRHRHKPYQPPQRILSNASHLKIWCLQSLAPGAGELSTQSVAQSMPAPSVLLTQNRLNHLPPLHFGFLQAKLSIRSRCIPSKNRGPATTSLHEWILSNASHLRFDVSKS